jgi:hypothetical protein
LRRLRFAGGVPWRVADPLPLLQGAEPRCRDGGPVRRGACLGRDDANRRVPNAGGQLVGCAVQAKASRRHDGGPARCSGGAKLTPSQYPPPRSQPRDLWVVAQPVRAGWHSGPPSLRRRGPRSRRRERPPGDVTGQGCGGHPWRHLWPARQEARGLASRRASSIARERGAATRATRTAAGRPTQVRVPPGRWEGTQRPGVGRSAARPTVSRAGQRGLRKRGPCRRNTTVWSRRPWRR